MFKRFLTTIWIELVGLIILSCGLEFWVVPMCINQRNDALFWVAIAIWVFVPVLILWVGVDMIRRWLRFSQNYKDAKSAK